MGDKGTILLAEDADINRLIIDNVLQTAGYDVVHARNGLEVLDQVDKTGVDLVLLDVMMPELDGYATLKRLRESYTLTQLPIIMLTGRNDSESVIAALRGGANDYATKPADNAVLLERIATHLKLKKPRANNIGRYELSRQLGTGAMGLVYSAKDTITGADVAVKILPRSLTIQLAGVQRFLREATLLERVRHAHIVRFLSAGHDQETYYLVMELVDGPTLGKLARQTPLNVSTVLEAARQVALGLAELHRHSIIHRDIKPSNLLICADSHLLKIADFGVARDIRDEGMRSQAGVVVGSMVFSAFEQLNGEACEQSDMYSLGCTLFYLLTSRLPFAPDKAALWYLDEKRRAPPLVTDVQECPRDVARFIGKLMDPKPARRYENDAALLDALDGLQLAHGRPTQADPLHWSEAR